MANPLLDLSTYTIRRKLLKLFGASFYVVDPNERLVGFSKQKAFKLREDIRVYTDDSMSTELLTIQARQVVDFSAAYDIVDAQEGVKVGAARRRGFKSIVRDSWEILDANDQPLGKIEEDSTIMALLRRVLSNLIPQRFHLTTAEGAQAEFRVHFNPFLYRMSVTLESGCSLDPRLVFGAAVLVAAIESRQS